MRFFSSGSDELPTADVPEGLRERKKEGLRIVRERTEEYQGKSHES